uniref:NADH-ubiquinone oxidoreductase chain 4L n=1 Tax=Pelusios castaneus TaxID=367368 RepID=A0A0A6ZDV2_9SAUR|nr:NADH dehydrogenase subunit 4L [Pelusios castaneus]AGL45240.1 NADH dehydrogenase subunit 4L [Pelusios castaneus]
MPHYHLILLIGFLISLVGFTCHQKHLISTLLALEGMTLTMFIAISMEALQLQTAPLMLSAILMLTFSACDTSVGLSLLVAASRTHGLDMLKNLNLLQC